MYGNLHPSQHDQTPVDEAKLDDVASPWKWEKPPTRPPLSARTALATCVESRQVAESLLPHRLSFRYLNKHYQVKPWLRQEGSLNAEVYLYGDLRFNGYHDVFLFEAPWDDACTISEIKRHRVPSGIKDMRKIAVPATALTERSWGVTTDGYYGSSWMSCACEADNCHDSCRQEPLPRLMRCFASAKTLFIADTRSAVVVNERVAPQREWKCRTCAAESDGGGHKWPTIPMADGTGLYVVCDEREGCASVRTHEALEKVRRGWRPAVSVL
ncbi:uncharacterized protein E0L32_000166 [Thyridium curvatum]|uniref:Uncharacterized protein n=1 Tax=Thyridium curvatum TaxID=1093900 RepID=A0A507B0Q3_9PEZI|nr:uncharacterized protein E0L32_000166 [Thyridium curvatum]TPX15832.1 hypothetical protein E0L32_000166 [Thyridium curvatum]